MKKTHYISLIMLLFCFSVFSQQNRGKKMPDKIKALKIAYITEKLNLTEKEAERFWPLYNTHQKRISELRREESRSIRRLADSQNRSINVDEISEANAKKVISAVANIQNKIHAENNSFVNRLEKIISYRKILRLQIAEREFKRQIFEKIRRKRKRYREE